jgi:hypothetical protein
MTSTIRRAVLAAALATLAAGAAIQPAEAQFYPAPPPVGGYYGGPGGYGSLPRANPRPDPYGGYYGGGYGQGYGQGYGRGYGGGYYQRPVIVGNVCYTSRGSCQTRPRPVESSCSCFIPGFGPKAGGVIAGGW